MTKVIFRKYKDNDIIALFPDTLKYGTVLSYMHVGQHGDADYINIISSTHLANETEYKDLYNELINIGYTDLKVVKRVNRIK